MVLALLWQRCRYRRRRTSCLLLRRGRSQGEGLLSQSSSRQLALSCLCEASPAGVPRIRPQAGVVSCYFTYFLDYKMFYFSGVSGSRWESSPARSRTNPRRSIAGCSRSNGLQIKIRGGCRGCVARCTQIPTAR